MSGFTLRPTGRESATHRALAVRSTQAGGISRARLGFRAAALATTGGVGLVTGLHTDAPRSGKAVVGDAAAGLVSGLLGGAMAHSRNAGVRLLGGFFLGGGAYFAGAAIGSATASPADTPLG